MQLPVSISQPLTINLSMCKDCRWTPAMKLDYVGQGGHGSYYFKCECRTITAGSMDLKEAISRWNKRYGLINFPE